jgi:sporulation protein YlmC with PRC-barrel domain
MTRRMSAAVLTALMLTVAAGTTVPAMGQSSDTPARGSAAVANTVDFRSSRWLNDRKVVNDNDEEIANVADLILDRGSGRIEYMVIRTGTTFGMGGRAVAVPYGSFRWEAGGKDRFVLPSTIEQLKQSPEYTPESWKAMRESVKDDRNALHQKLATDAASINDPYAGGLDTAKSARISGRVRSVDRIRTSTFGEQLQITVETADGPARKIALGPSWYVNGSAAAPMRGDMVVVETLALPRDADQLLVGTKLRTGDRELRLRESDGTPVWSLKTIESGGHTYSAPYSRYLLLSNLPGTKVDCRGDECGKVQDVIIDRNSGEIGFLSIDPNQNFLGIGDTKRLIPWSVATVTLDGTMRIDASKEMVLASPETPADLSTLNTGTHAERVYKAFNVPTPRFEVFKSNSAVSSDAASAWLAGGSILSGIEKDSTKAISGEVIGFSEVKFEGGVQPARAMRVRSPVNAGGEELVLLGPVWYLDNQKPVCLAGDSIKVEVCRTTIDGRRYWIAKSTDCKGTRIVLLDGNNAPAWAKP